MKNVLLFASATSMAAALAAPAFATPAANSVTGSVNVTGSVAAFCSSQSFSDTIALNELSKPTDGTLDTTVPNNTGLTKSFKIVCTSALPTVDVSASRLAATGSTSPGFTNVIDYTATATAHLAGGGSTNVAYTTAATLPAATSTKLTDRLANAGTNLDVTFSGAHTTNATDQLIAGTYASVITVTVEPTS